MPSTPLPGRLVVVRARGGQPAFGFYARDPDTGSYYTVGLMVLTLSGTQISALTRFDPAVLPRFGLPPFLSN
jgi:RNA polymerase sigma-70 factor, ECF subfamily